MEEEKENRVKGKMVVSQLRNDVEQRGQLHNWSSSDVSAAQQILTQYCQSNAIAYQHEILMLLAPFMQHLGESEEDTHATSPMTMLEVYHCLSSFVQQFVPFLKSDTADHSVMCVLGMNVSFTMQSVCVCVCVRTNLTSLSKFFLHYKQFEVLPFALQTRAAVSRSAAIPTFR